MKKASQSLKGDLKINEDTILLNLMPVQQRVLDNIWFTDR